MPFMRDRSINFLYSFIFLAAAALLAAAPAHAQAIPQPQSLPERLSASFASVAKAVEPAVVSIDAKSNAPQLAAQGTPAPGDSDDLLDIFRNQLRSRPVYAVGSGFIIDPAGYIITNNHVIANAARINVKLDSGEELPARLVGTDEETDLAVLKVTFDKPLPFVKLGDSEKMEVGDWVLALGSPFGLEKTVTAGIISQKGRQTPNASAFQRFIQTDAAINQGNSGGPLVNMEGEVIGVNSQIATANGGSSGIGFALPSTETLNVYRQIVANGRVRRGYMGTGLDSVRAEYAKVYGLPSAKGAIVTDVRDKQAPAGLAGLQPGDVIVSFNGKEVANAVDLIAKVSATPPDETVNIEYYRETATGMERKTAAIKLQERASRDRSSADSESRKLPLDRTKPDPKPFGITLTDLTASAAATYKLDGKKGLLIKEIDPASYVADLRSVNGEPALGVGDLIQRFNRTDVTDLASFIALASKINPGDAVVFQILSFDPRTATPQFKVVQFTAR
ncbi:MAG: trypsin-like peptidase domain-containing protein [Acidobacteriota bacterium]